MPCPSSLSAYAFYRAEVRLVLHIMEREERVKPKRACRPNNGDEGSEKGGKRGTLLFHLPYHRHPKAGAERIGGE